MATKSDSVAVSASDQTVDLKGIFKNLVLWTDSGSADVTLVLDDVTAVAGAAGTIKIQAGGSNGIALTGLYLSKFHFIGASAAGRLNYVAT